MNIQFMTKEKNGVPTGKFDWRGEERCRFIPDFDEMVKNASCEAEADAVKEVQTLLNDGLFDGFTFEIVYMAYAKSVDFVTGESKMKWQMMQHPWYRTHDGIYATQDEMINDITSCMRSIEEA